MFGGDEDPGRVVDVYDGVARRMHHHQRLAETLHRGADFLRPDVVEKLLLDPEITAGDADPRVAFRVDFLERVLDQAQDVVRVEGRSDGRDRGRLGDPRSRGEHRRAAEAVPDQERRGAVLAPEEVRRGDEIVDVRGEIGVREITLAPAQAGEIEAQHGKPLLGERGADRGRGLALLGAGEAVGEDGVGERRPGGRVEPRGERRTECAGKSHGSTAGCHMRSCVAVASRG